MQDSSPKIHSFFIFALIIAFAVFLYREDTVSLIMKIVSPTKVFEESKKILAPLSQKGLARLAKQSATTTTFLKATTLVTPKKKTPSTPQTTTTRAIDVQESDTRPLAERPIPCVSSIPYTLGSFDTRFAISKSYFIQKLEESSSVWNTAVHKNLFVYDPAGNKGDLVVNLVYDARQQRTDSNKLIIAEINNTKEVALVLEKEYEAMKLVFTKLKDGYAQGIDAFNTRQKIYNDTVTSWNEKGGAPAKEYDALMAEKATLEQISNDLTNQRQTLDTMLIAINDKIAKHNDLVLFANEKVALLNNNEDTKFMEGMYSPMNNSITIYQFTDDIKLYRVLAHEFGHALGINHTQDPESIMYAVNSATSTYLTQEDLQAVQDICSQR